MATNTVDDRGLVLGRIYAKALLDLAEEQGKADELLEELNALADFLESQPQISELFATPFVDAKERARSLETVFRGRADDLLVDAMQVLNRKGRLGFMRTLARAYWLELRDRRGQMDVTVRTAVPLSGPLRERLKEAVAGFTGLEPILIEKVDPSVLGGMVVVVAGTKIDTSVASRLRDLGAAFERRSSEEIQRGSAAYISEQ
jgi:F-type H+-transporting ATPase subunit delta